jgi:hypothetical protein
MSISPQYLANLTPQQRVLQSRLIRQSQREYAETGVVKDRPPVSKSQPKRSKHAAEFQERYGFPVTNQARVKQKFPDTKVKEIVAKGLAAYSSSGSRPNVTAQQWAMARLASVLTGGKAYQIDKDLVGERSRKIIFADK